MAIWMPEDYFGHPLFYIRLKSLGEYYSEYALRNRLRSKANFEHSIEEQIQAEPKQNTPKLVILRTIRFYTESFAKNALPMRKRNLKKPFSWKNDAELDRLLSLIQKINEGATLDSLRREFAEQEKRVAVCEAARKKSEHDLNVFLDLKEKIGIVYEGKHSALYTYDQATADLLEYPKITDKNYRNIEKLIAAETESLREAERRLQAETAKLNAASELVTAMERVMGGTYVQDLVAGEQQRRESDFVPNGLKMW